MDAVTRTKPYVGVFVPMQTAEALHAYLMTRPCSETLDLVIALRQAATLTRVPNEAKA